MRRVDSSLHRGQLRRAVSHMHIYFRRHDARVTTTDPTLEEHNGDRRTVTTLTVALWRQWRFTIWSTRLSYSVAAVGCQRSYTSYRRTRSERKRTLVLTCWLHARAREPRAGSALRQTPSRLHQPRLRTGAPVGGALCCRCRKTRPPSTRRLTSSSYNNTTRSSAVVYAAAKAASSDPRRRSSAPTCW